MLCGNNTKSKKSFTCDDNDEYKKNNDIRISCYRYLQTRKNVKTVLYAVRLKSYVSVVLLLVFSKNSFVTTTVNHQTNN